MDELRPAASLVNNQRTRQKVINLMRYIMENEDLLYDIETQRETDMTDSQDQAPDSEEDPDHFWEPWMED